MNNDAWQPIETAKDNDGFFIVCNRSSYDYDTTVAVVWWNRDKTVFICHYDEIDREMPYLDGPATDWQPLPAPPKEKP